MSCLIYVVVVAYANSEGINFTGMYMELFHKLYIICEEGPVSATAKLLFVTQHYNTGLYIGRWYVVRSDDNNSIYLHV